MSCGHALAGSAPAPAGSGHPPQPATWQPPPPDEGGFQSQQAVVNAEAPPSSGFAFAETAPPLSDSAENRALHAALNSQPPPAPAASAQPSGAAYPSAVPANVPSGKNPLSVPPDAPRILVGFLASYEGSELGHSWQLFQGRNTVGRKGASAGLDVEIAHATTSSRHCIIHACAHPGRVALEDCGSTNGTFVNDVALAPNAPHEISDGDRLRFGLFTATIKII